MLNQFHPDTAAAITSRVSMAIIDRQTSGLVHIGEIARRQKELLEKAPDERLRIMQQRALEQVNLGRALVRRSPERFHLVYDLCKKVYDLAELEQVDFNGVGYTQKFNLIHQLVPFADAQALANGVREYHDSRISLNWHMSYLQEQNPLDGQAAVL